VLYFVLKSTALSRLLLKNLIFSLYENLNFKYIYEMPRLKKRGKEFPFHLGSQCNSETRLETI